MPAAGKLLSNGAVQTAGDPRMDESPALPAGLTSLAPAWRAALERVEYTRASPEFERKLIGACTGTQDAPSLESSTHFAFSAAQNAALAGDFAQAHRLYAALADNGERLAAQVLCIDPRHGPAYVTPLASVLHHALAVGARADAAPARAPLRTLVEYLLGRLPKSKRANPHQSVLLQIRTAAHAALLAQDLELLQRVVQVRSTIASFPRQWRLFHEIARVGRNETHGGDDFLRVDDAGVREEFMAVFQAHRQPWFNDAQVLLGEQWYTASLIGGFVHAWTYLQTFAPEPTTRCEWPALRELLVG